MGRIEIPKLDRDYVVVEGTDLGTLRKGPGHYPKTPFPGEGGTVAVAGHRTTYGAPFRTVDKLEEGDKLDMDMPYGKFTYRVDKIQIVKPTPPGSRASASARALVLSRLPPALQRGQADRRVLTPDVRAQVGRSGRPAGRSPLRPRRRSNRRATRTAARARARAPPRPPATATQ